MTEHPAIENLRTNQTQLDADGCMVGVSRQAVEETLAEIASLRSSIENLQDDLTDQTERGDQATTAVHSLRAAARQDAEALAFKEAMIEGFCKDLKIAGEAVDNLVAARCQDAEEKARLTEALGRADGIIKWMAVDIGGMCPPEDGLSNLNKHWIFMETRAALACRQGEKSACSDS